MNEINQLVKVSKFLQRLAYFLFIFIWGEFVFYFTNYSSPGQLFYNEYGENGIGLYLVFIFTLIIILSAQSKKISDLAKKIKENE